MPSAGRPFPTSWLGRKTGRSGEEERLAFFVERQPVLRQRGRIDLCLGDLHADVQPGRAVVLLDADLLIAPREALVFAISYPRLFPNIGLAGVKTIGYTCG